MIRQFVVDLVLRSKRISIKAFISERKGEQVFVHYEKVKHTRNRKVTFTHYMVLTDGWPLNTANTWQKFDITPEEYDLLVATAFVRASGKPNYYGKPCEEGEYLTHDNIITEFNEYEE